jgi:Domain of Unknown Function (DUF1080)
MTRRLPLIVPLAASLAAGLLPTPARAQTPPAGFTPIFNGTDLAGWHGREGVEPARLATLPPAERATRERAARDVFAKHWRVENGELVNDGNGPFATTDRDYGDIELRLEYRTVAKADSGVYLRGIPQVQIWDDTQEGGKWNIGADKGSGGLWNNPAGAPGKDPLAKMDKPFGEWNALRILQVGERTTIYLNGTLVVDHARMHNTWEPKAPLPRVGPLQLQTHGGEIRWRRIVLREIPAEEANRLLAAKGAAGLTPIFNGKDFTGWSGPIDNYQVADGAIMCKPGKGGTIHTTATYKDFVARIEFQLPPGGNNGLAIRYPGEGDAAYAGMTELQVLDNTAEKYAKLDPRQFHGSAYGMAAAAKGYLRPVGEWNVQEVTVRGSTIRVELNGTVILDTDLSTAKDFMANSPHPGKDRTEGHFGFAGHGDPVKFRAVSIKPL